MAYGSPEHRAAFQRFVSRTEKHETAVATVTADLMRRQKQAVLAKVKEGRSLKRDAAEADDFPFNKARWIKQFRETIRPVLTEIVKDAGSQALEDLDIASAFDVTDPNVRQFLMQRAQRFAVEVNETTWEQLRASLADGMDGGEGIDQLAARVNAVMGDRIRSSGEVIARTESLGAYSGGVTESWRQSGVVKGKTWLSAIDDRTRPDHVDAHGQEVGLDEDFDVGDASGPGPGMMDDPAQDCNCRCSMTAVLDTD
jgi:SPP1 gp7 family putative phage head morphogenesis protein